ncbi:hypothetical protein AO073_06045 [Pseudomonas syringae ICMP 11293]|uniref:hypothetical protein n=1 Tax=Pseudomonas syringae TaxID=317 RepID=UPI00072FF282|nr:hypothetical protein [Pseudomonas syringae]KTB91378.1 hypothetical protein AO073_06045 [Pseudomonas syringae ICMP 11293]
MSYRDDVPTPVIKAAQVEFDLPITAILYLPEIEGFSLVGNIFNDSRAQFADWRLIRTSTVVEFSECSGYTIASTFSGSSYALVSSKGADVQTLLGDSLFELSSH